MIYNKIKLPMKNNFIILRIKHKILLKSNKNKIKKIKI